MNAERETKMHTCKRGHVTEVHRHPGGQWGACNICASSRKKAYYQAKREACRQAWKAYYEANKTHLTAHSAIRSRERYAAIKAMPDDAEPKLALRAYSKAYYAANRERIAERRKEKRAKEKREQDDNT